MRSVKKLSPSARRKLRVRNRLRKVAQGRVCLSIFRSSKNIYAQIIDLADGCILASASSLDKELKIRGKCNVDSATKIGKLIAKRAQKAGVEQVFFDRGAYLFHGRIKALANAAREGGLKF